ncbi:MAG: PEP-CTERM sorting domain-containing protein [Desulfobacteraceae bacterium]|nr:PEP-CTERM sorting domain-containing protein [Desulfobacteraceae bacterium]
MKTLNFSLVALILLTLLFFVPTSHATTIWDESVNGDLSNISSAPSDISVLISGSNIIVGSIGAFFTSDNTDIFNFTVPAGYVLSNVILETYDYGASYDYVPVTLFDGATSSDPIIEFMLLTEWGAGTDLLQFDSAPGAQSAGIYTMKFSSKQPVNSSGSSLYSVNLIVSPTPEPSTFFLFGIGIIGLAGSKLRRKKNHQM